MVEPKMCYRITSCKPCLYNQGCSGSSGKTLTTIEPVVDEGPTLDQMLAKLPDEDHFADWVYKKTKRRSNPLSFFWAWHAIPAKIFEERFIIPYTQEMGYDYK